VISRVTVAQGVAALAADRYPHERPGDGSPCESDFWSGPLAAALLMFRDFDALPFPDVPAIRIYVSADPVFGAVAFTGVRIGQAEVEIDGFDADPDDWQLIADEPEDG
jgi:hypothetical protein